MHESSQAAGQDDAVAKMKTLLDEGRHIELDELFTSVVSETAASISDEDRFPRVQPQVPIHELIARANRYQKAIVPLLSSLVVGCAWGQARHEILWSRAVERVANVETKRAAEGLRLEISRYPLILAIYSAGLAAVSRENYGALRAVTTDAHFREADGRSRPIVAACHLSYPVASMPLVAYVLAREAAGDDANTVIERIQRGGRERESPLAMSESLRDRLRPLFTTLLPDEREYREAFDRLEMLLGVIVTDAQIQAEASHQYCEGPWYGLFVTSLWSVPPEAALLAEATQAGNGWPPLGAGLFGGSTERAAAALDRFIQGVGRPRQRAIAGI